MRSRTSKFGSSGGLLICSYDHDDGYDDIYECGHQLGHVVCLPDAPGHARGVEVAGRLLHGDLAGQQGGHLVYVPLQALTQ